MDTIYHSTSLSFPLTYDMFTDNQICFDFLFDFEYAYKVSVVILS